MSDAGAAKALFKGKTLLWAVIGAALATVLIANAHLVYVAVTSQPDCVTHTRRGEMSERAQFSAAKSSCTPR